MAWAAYHPLPRQEAIHQALERVLLISGGEGSGKSLVTAAEIVARYGLWHLVYIVAPKYDSAHKEIDYAFEMLSRFGAVAPGGFARPKTGKAVLTTEAGGRIETLSAQDGPQAITGTGESPDILAMVEAGKVGYDIYLACRARVARSRGLLILSGTIEESERWYPELIERWHSPNPEGARSFILPTWANTALYPGGENDPEILALRATFPPDKFQERFAAVPCRPSDVVIPEFSFAEHVQAWCAFDARAPVELWIDPGYAGSHYAVCAVQFDRRGTREIVKMIDELYLDHATTQEAIAAARQKAWWGNVPRRVDERGEWKFRGTGGVIDIAAKAHAALPSVWEVWNEAGIALRTNRVEVAAGVELHRTFLKPPDDGEPRLYFNPACKGTFAEYTDWRRKRIGDGLYAEPSDKRCDAMKALQYGLYDRYGALGQRRQSKPVMVERDMYAEEEAFNLR